MLVPVLASVAAAACVLRLTVTRRRERAYARLRPPGADGIVSGAEGFSLQGSNGRAILLLHGSGDTPQTLRYLGGRLHDAGFTVVAPLLPGHGRGLRNFATATASEYVAHASAELATLREANTWVGLVGLSMGGALAARLAAENGEVRVLILLAPYLIASPRVRAIAWAAPILTLVLPYLNGRGGSSVHDPVARDASYAYGVFPPRAVRALVATADAGRRVLRDVTAATLVVNSREDNRIPLDLAEAATATLKAPTERHWVAGCGHVITVDYCRDAVARLVLDFLARHAD